MVCRIKPRVSLQLLLVVSNLPLLPGFSKWWRVGAVVVCLGWKQTFVLSLEKRLSLSFSQNAWLMLHWTQIFYIILFQASFLTTWVFPPDCIIFVLMTSKKEMTMQRKLNCQGPKHEKNFPFQLLLFFSLFYYPPIQRNLRSVEMNGNLSSDLSGAWISFFMESLLWTLIILYKSNCSLSIVLLHFKSEWCHKRPRIWIQWKQLLLFFKLVSLRLKSTKSCVKTR